jgi:hypothetical protein
MKRCTALAPLTCLYVSADSRTKLTPAGLANSTEAIT